jgi:hypothetical protein
MLGLFLAGTWHGQAATADHRDTVAVDRLQPESSVFEYPAASGTTGGIETTACLAYDDSTLVIGLIGNWPVNLRVTLTADEDGGSNGSHDFTLVAWGIDTLALERCTVTEGRGDTAAERTAQDLHGLAHLSGAFDPSASGKRSDRRFRMILRIHADPLHRLTLHAGDLAGLRLSYQSDERTKRWVDYFGGDGTAVMKLR